MRNRVMLLAGLLVAFFGFGLFLWAIWFYRSTMELANHVLRPDSGDAVQSVIRLQRGFAPAAWVIDRLPLMPATARVKAASEVMSRLDILLGVDGRREYILLLQNNMELRPTGGFMGSYAVLVFERGQLTQMKVEDIYTPDGQIKGYVPEPKPISQHLFNQGTPGWRLRDANWHPDFRESAKAIEWFFREGGYSAPDGFGAVTLEPLVHLLRLMGSLQLPDYGSLVITADNFYAKAQDHAETDFFPGSTQKRDFLASVSRQMLLAMADRPSMAPLVISAALTALEQKELLLFVPDVTGPGWGMLGWDGGLRTYSSDYLMVNEANVGITKANCCIRRSLKDVISVDGDQVKHQLELWYHNDNPPAPKPPYFWGGGYKNYLRIIVPKGSSLSLVEVNGKAVDMMDIEIEEFDDHMAFGFLSLVPGGESSVIKIQYQTSAKAKAYSLQFQKQTGIGDWPVEIKNANSSVKKSVNTDELFRIRLK